MSSIHPRRAPRLLLGLVALVVAALAFAAATNVAGAADAPQSAKGSKHTTERLVVRGDATVVDTQCDAGICFQFTNASFRGTPVGTGAYTGSMELKVAETFANGEGGVCAPLRGHIVLGAGSPDRLILAVAGDSCQDGAGNPTTTSFTTLTEFSVKYGTGKYAGAHGSGIASFSEDAADHDRMTLIGRISL
jgi:hypothetical protein